MKKIGVCLLIFVISAMIIGVGCGSSSSSSSATATTTNAQTTTTTSSATATTAAGATTTTTVAGATTTTTSSSITTTTQSFTLTCPNGFSNGESIPNKYAYEGGNTSIPLQWSNSPSGVGSYVVLMYDINTEPFYMHWVVKNIPHSVSSISEGASQSSMPNNSVELTNGYGSAGYLGPDPPQSHSYHIYTISIYAIQESSLSLSGQPSYMEALIALASATVLDSTSIIGTYDK